MNSENITPLRDNDNRQWVYRAPVVVTGLIVLMVALHVLLAIGPKPQTLYLEFWGSLIPARYGPGMIGNSNPFLLIVPPFTHMFLHGGITHLALNMMFMLAFATPEANRFLGASPVPQSGVRPAMAWQRGGLTFLAFFIASGLAGGLLFCLLHLNDPVRAVGASGAISALMAAAIRIARPVRGMGMVNIDGPLMPVTNGRVMKFTISIIVLNVLIGVLGNTMMPGGAQIAWEAHIGGYLFGLFALPVFDAAARKARNDLPTQY